MSERFDPATVPAETRLAILDAAIDAAKARAAELGVALDPEPAFADTDAAWLLSTALRDAGDELSDEFGKPDLEPMH